MKLKSTSCLMPEIFFHELKVMASQFYFLRGLKAHRTTIVSTPLSNILNFLLSFVCELHPRI